MAGDASVNHIHVSQNAADGASPLNCSPACPQQPPQDDATDYEDDYGGENQNGGKGHATPPKSNSPKPSQKSPPKGGSNKPANGNKRGGSATTNEIPRSPAAPSKKQTQAPKQNGGHQNGKQAGKPPGGNGNSGKPAGGGNSNKIANNNDVKANACPGRGIS
jgi:hypothetical protein